MGIVDLIVFIIYELNLFTNKKGYSAPKGTEYPRYHPVSHEKKSRAPLICLTRSVRHLLLLLQRGSSGGKFKNHLNPGKLTADDFPSL